SLDLCFLFCFFFFQAEDGIRDFHVTGVQTCALPISQGVALLEKRNCALPLMPALAVGLALAAPVSTLALLAGLFSGLLAGWGARPPVSTSTEAKAMPWVLGCRAARSEERRVGTQHR